MKNKESSASKIVLDSFESLFGDQEDMGKEDRVRMIPLSELYEFAGHPFRVLDDEKMQETVESVKAASDLISPVSGTVVEINEALEDEPERINQDAFENWIIKVELSDKSELDNLMDAAAYTAFCNK